MNDELNIGSKIRNAASLFTPDLEALTLAVHFAETDEEKVIAYMAKADYHEERGQEQKARDARWQASRLQKDIEFLNEWRTK